MARAVGAFPRSLLIALLLLAAAVVAFWLLRPGGGDADTPRGNLEGASIGGPFQLVDESGQPVTEKSWPGQWRLMYFGFTYCPDICPTDMAKLGEGLRQFEAASPDRAAKVQPLFVSVDPERDTPAALTEFTDHFHPRIVGLTGTTEQVAAMLKAYRIYAQKAPGATEGSYLVDHMAIFYLFDPEGRPIAFLAPLSAGAEQVHAMLAAHVR